MNNQLLISVIVPIYNIDHYLDRCIKSIVNQTYKNLEIILIDDGSTDKSSMICDTWQKKDKRIVVIHKANEGVVKARKTGIEISNGHYIGFVDGDDIIENDMYEILIKNIISYNADISHCGYQMIFDDGHIHQFYDTGKLIVQGNFEGQKDLLLGEFIEPGLCNKLYKKDLFNHLHYDETIKINEDLMINFLLFQKCKRAVYYDVCKYHYMAREGSSSRGELNSNKIYDPIKVKKFIKENIFKSLKKIAEKAYFITCINVYNTLVLSENNLFLKDKNEIRNLIIREKKNIKILSKKQRLLATLIIYFPFFYDYLYKIYRNNFQISKYD